MSTAAYQQHTFPTAPPSPSAGEHEMRDYHAAQDASRPAWNDEFAYSRGLTPYLGLRARLSQIWINKWTVLLLLALVRTLVFIVSLNKEIGQARSQALSGCSDVEGVGSAMASMPHYMSQGVNELAADGINKAVNGLMTMLLMSITGVEEIVLFVIDMMTSTYLCLITLAVSGSLHVAVQVAEDVANFLNSTLHDIGNDIQNGVNDFESGLNKVISGIDKALGAKIPNLNMDEPIGRLDNLQLPSSLDEGLNKLNASIPTFADVQNFTNNAIAFPFEEVKMLINQSLPNYTFNGSLLPLPQKQSLSFCSGDDGINTFFDMLLGIIMLARKIFIIVLVLLAVLACIPMAYREIRRWNWMKLRAKYIAIYAWDPLDAVYIISRPYTAAAGLAAAKRVKSGRRKTLVRWTVAYATTLPALFVLSLGVAGLMGCLCQFILLKAVQKEVPKLENEVVDFADKVVNSLTEASNQWAVGTNDIINQTNTKINHDVFGWVNTTTSAVNNTLNIFVDQTTNVLNQTFGGTVLYEPILDVLNCLVLLKIKGIENGLTWVQDHAHIDFPMLPNDTFTRGALATINQDTAGGNGLSQLLASPNTGASDKITAAVKAMMNSIEDELRTEVIISACVVGIWVIIALIGFFRALFLLFWPDKHDYDGNNPFEDPSVVVMEKDSPAAMATGNYLKGFFSKNKFRPVIEEPIERSTATSPSPPYEPTVNGDNTANKYNGQEYTLARRPLPTHNADASNEKFGIVGAHNVGGSTTRPNPFRTSSHPIIASGSSPTEERHPIDPFTDDAR